jgi:hypothetical protein
MQDKTATRNVTNVSIGKKKKKSKNKTAMYQIIILPTICKSVELDLSY